MEDTKTLIYILLAIGWLIYNFIKKSSSGKSVSKPENKDSETQEPKDVITMLEELLGEKTQKEFHKPVPTDIITQNLPKPKKEKPKYISLEDEAMAKVEGAPEKRIKSSFREVKPLETEPEIELDLDPRKMVLYSEIMKRPNY